MTVSGFVSGLLDPHGAGFALSRVANRAEAGRVQEIAPAKAAGGCDCGQPDCPSCAGGSASKFLDRVELSPEALTAADRQQSASQAADASQSDPRSDASSPAAGNATGQELTEEQQTQVDELKQRDREVRQHEQAHLAAAGPYAVGGPTYEYQTGPDGKRYAIGGEVQIDTAPIEGDPEATIRKMETVRAAALAPAEPSSQDRSVAAQASQEIQRARAEQATEQSGDVEVDSDRQAEAGRAAGSVESPYDRRQSPEPELIDLLV